ncbi:carboxylesterase family protein [Streptomyces sp. NPDC001833]|uniref:carboxylesterase/lipase family protein n=1 Tax=Streptomyces sp. NPDC001833 TaxID=3154658 RepID=UPI003317CAD0
MTTPDSAGPLSLVVPDERRLVVPTTAGAVRGRREDRLTVFRGVPFAAPPVGEARFQAPRPPEPWDGVRETYAFGPPPPQAAGFWHVFDDTDVPAGDDWLTVNVWTPDADPAAGRPVMVWIYGGAYKLGHAGSPGYDAQHIARDGDVVVVTFNHRIGVEGYLWIEGAPANRGLLDQVAALEWVRDNIGAFGGDPGQVTVFGESAGAGAVAALLAMPSARGLFHRAIVQSAPASYFSDELARDLAAAIAAEVGLRPTVADLSTVDPRKLVEAGEALSAKTTDHVAKWGQLSPFIPLTPFAPVVDGEVLPTTPGQALAAGAARDIELIAGHTAQEHRLFLLLADAYGKATDEQATALLRLLSPGGEAGERAYREAYPDAGPDELVECIVSDWLFRMPTLRLAEAQVQGGGRAHFYELTWSAPVNGGVFGACHALDIPLLFGTFEADFGRVLFGGEEVTEEATDLAARIRRAWTTFARTGDPDWPAYDTQRRLVQVFDAEPGIREYPEEASRKLWEGYDFPPLPLLG